MPATAENRAEPADVPIPRRGRIWVVLALALALLALGYALVGIATQKAGRGRRPRRRHRRSAGNLRRRAAGRRPARLLRRAGLDPGLQRPAVLSCREDFLSTIPGLVERYARPGDVKLLYRHYSVSESPQELGFYGAEAAAQQGYGWQYTYLFFRNQDEAKRFGIDQRLPRLGGGRDRGTERARMAGIPRRRRRLRRRDQPAARRLRRTRRRASASAPARRRSSAARAAPAPSRTARPWPRSKPRSKPSSSPGPGLG